MLGDGESSRLQAVLKHKKGLVTNAGTYLFTLKKMAFSLSSPRLGAMTMRRWYGQSTKK